MTFLSSREDKAFCSWLVDCLQCVSVLVLLACWMSDAGNPTEPRFLDPTFLSTGFCNHDTWDTQWVCAMVDFAAGALFLAMALLDSSSVQAKTVALPTAAYLVSHGYGHFQVALRSPEEVPTGMSNSDLLVLAGIIYIGPISAGKDLTSVGGFQVYTSLIRVVSVVVVAALVLGYKLVLGNGTGNYALLYINITIILTALLPRCLWIGYTNPSHAAFRIDPHHYFWPRMLTRSYIGAMVLLEPFGCGAFLQKAGGHLLFDVSLLLDSAVELLNCREQNRLAAVGDDVLQKKTN